MIHCVITVDCKRARVADLSQNALRVVRSRHIPRNTLTHRRHGTTQTVRNNRRTVSGRRTLISDLPLNALSAVDIRIVAVHAQTLILIARCSACTVGDGVTAVGWRHTRVIDPTSKTCCVRRRVDVGVTRPTLTSARVAFAVSDTELTLIRGDTRVADTTWYT